MAHSRLFAMASATTTMSTAESVPENAPMDLSHHFNATSRSRNSNAMKELYKYFMTPGMTNLAGGMSPCSKRISSCLLMVVA